MCDGYGRLPGSAERLAEDVVPNWCGFGLEETAIEQARDALVAAGLWYLYTAADGKQYVEYVNWDEEQTDAYMDRRAARPGCPDPPDRPDLWACNRVHRPLKAEPGQNVRQIRTSTPAGGAAPQSGNSDSGAPTPGGEQGAGPALDAGATTGLQLGDDDEPAGFWEIVKQQSKYRGGAVVREDQKRQVRQVLERAERVGVPWQDLLQIMIDLQERATETIERIGYYAPAWNERIDAGPAPPTSRAATPPPSTRPLSTEQIA